MAAPLTDAAIASIRTLIARGDLGPGDRLPSEQELSSQLGVSRNSTREAVRALVTVRVLDVRRGDGTYVTSLAPELLLEGVGVAAELVQEDSVLELVEARRVLEPQVTALAALRATPAQRAEMAEHLDLMRASRDPEELVRHDADFHAAVSRASGNGTLASVLIGISGVTVRTRVWRGLLEGGAVARTIAEHEAIHAAVDAGDPRLAEAAALVHVATTEAWVRRVLGGGSEGTGEPSWAGRGPS